MFYIYKISNSINGKVYIGQSKQPKIRWATHKNSKKSKLGRSIQKHGKENFTFEIIDSTDSIEQVSKLEVDYIRKYNSYKNGYNATDVSCGCHINHSKGPKIHEKDLYKPSITILRFVVNPDNLLKAIIFQTPLENLEPGWKFKYYTFCYNKTTSTDLRMKIQKEFLI